MNQELIRQMLKTMGKATKSAVAHATGLSLATCGNILNELLAAGELLELEAQEINGGRPAKVYAYNMDFAYIACVIVKAGVTVHSLDYVVTNLAGEMVEQGQEEHKPLDFAVIDQLVDRLTGSYPQIQAVGIGVPGAVDHGVMNVGDIEELIHVELESLIRDKYEIEVIIENDMNLTVYGFYNKQHYEDEKTVAVATFIEGSYPGAGMMVNGRIHRGHTRFAGEIAFLPYGLTRDEQFQQLHNREMFPSMAARAVSSLIAVMNPETIALTGSLIHLSDLSLIHKECLKVIPEQHMPELILLEQPDVDYMQGLITMTLDSLAYTYQLVEKRK